MGEINIFEYKGFKDTFRMVAPLKHGTRWLESAWYLSKDGYSGHSPNELKSALFKSPTTTSSIQIRKTKRELINPNTFFVWRDPYDCFVSALTTGAWEENTIWDGTNENLDILMVKNEHFYPFMWQNISKILDECMVDDGEVGFVHLSELSKFFRIKTLLNVDYKRENYTFDDKIKGGLRPDELIELCKKWHPDLFNNFLEAIELERAALKGLVDRWGISTKVNII